MKSSGRAGVSSAVVTSATSPPSESVKPDSGPSRQEKNGSWYRMSQLQPQRLIKRSKPS